MALNAGEVWSGGFIRQADGSLVVTLTNAGSAQYSGGYWRDADGRLIVIESLTAGALFSGGKLRDPALGLTTTLTTTGERPSGGFQRAPDGSLVIAASGGVANAGGFLCDANNNLVVTVV